jgi:hypothetical protein
MNIRINEIINKRFYYLILSLFLIESLSFLSYFFPILRELSFFLILLVVVFLAIKDLKYAIYVVIIELLIGSHGYIFFADIFNYELSIRIAMWLAVMIVWFFKYVIWLKNYIQAPKNERKNQSISNFFAYFPIYILLSIFILIASIKGVALSSNLGVWFSDFNSWLYFLILLPLINIFRNNNFKNLSKDLILIFLAGVTWISIKTLILLFFFSHNLAIIEPLYAWSRGYLLAEITAQPSGFYRIFFQSHIYSLMLIIIALFSFNDLKELGYKQHYTFMAVFSVIFSSILLSLSRSLWVGLILGLIIWLVYIIIKYKKKIVYYNLSRLLLIVFSALILIVAVINIPLPGYSSDFNAGKTFKERANIKDSDEAAISSRWSLLGPMFEEILKAPIIGHGFGKEITYISHDPRVLENNSSGKYTSTAFEWGWLSVLLKMGLLGLLVYLWLFYRLISDAFKSRYNKVYMRALALSLLALMSVNFFTPYLDHPLGIMYLLIISLFISSNKYHYLKN